MPRVASDSTQVDHLLDRITQSEAPSVVAAHERRIRELEEEKLVREERIAALRREKPRSYEDALRTAVELLVNPCELWEL